MHPRVIGERKETAQRRIQAAVLSLTRSLDIAPMGVVSEPEKRDHDVRQMRELELVADVLEQAAESAGNKATLLENAPKTLDDFIASLSEDEHAEVQHQFERMMAERMTELDIPASGDGHESSDGKRKPGRPRKES